MSRAAQAWEAVEKQVSYFERQCELFSASVSSFISAKTGLLTQNTYHGSKSLLEEQEHAFLNFDSNCNVIVSQMEGTLRLIEKDLKSFEATCAKDEVTVAQLKLSCEHILTLCREQLDSCILILERIRTDSLMSEDTYKSMLTVIIHRPFIWDVKSRLFPDIKSLLLRP